MGASGNLIITIHEAFVPISDSLSMAVFSRLIKSKILDTSETTSALSKSFSSGSKVTGCFEASVHRCHRTQTTSDKPPLFHLSITTDKKPFEGGQLRILLLWIAQVFFHR